MCLFGNKVNKQVLCLHFGFKNTKTLLRCMTLALITKKIKLASQILLESATKSYVRRLHFPAQMIAICLVAHTRLYRNFFRISY